MAPIMFHAVMETKASFTFNRNVKLLALKKNAEETNAEHMEAMDKTQMAIGGPFSLDIIQMRYAKKSWPIPPIIPPAKGIENQCAWRESNEALKSLARSNASRKCSNPPTARATTTSWATTAD
jgi:hypothetical protein